MAANLLFNDTTCDYTADLTREIEIVKNSPITEYFTGKTIFLTGASGFLGQLYLEKLLRIGAKCVYIFLRPKKDYSPKERLQKLLESHIFAKLQKEQPKIAKKIIIISGTLDTIGLGINQHDYQEIIKNVDIILHSAADVRFDVSLLELTLVNLRGTQELLRLADNVINLKMFVYISTAYSNCIRNDINEEFYSPPIQPDIMIKMAEQVETDQQRDLYEILTAKIIEPWPNTYTFTKALSENIVKNFPASFPIVVVRPSIIIATFTDPISGWLNNFNGANGLLYGIGSGILRCFPGSNEIVTDMVCADIVSNATLAAMCYTDKDNEEKKKHGEQRIEPQIFNVTSGNMNPITLGCLVKQLLEIKHDTPVTRCIWYPTIKLTGKHLSNSFYTILFHAIPAIFLDIFFGLTNNKLRLLPMYRKLGQFTSVLTIFLSQQWNFNNKNVLKLLDRMTDYDKEYFPSDMRILDWNDYLFTYAMGVRKYLFKESDDDADIVSRNRKHVILKISHFTLKGIIYFIYLYLIWYIMLPYLFEMFN